MASGDGPAPDVLPMLAGGKHRNSRKGACFMELASLLAGERWSDNPTCTHPLLSKIARGVNDWTSDSGRQRLAVLVPSVIGLTSEDLRVDARVALTCATMALPVVAEQRQRAMAVSILVAERVLADLEGRPAGRLQERSMAALAEAPDAQRWADAFTRRLPFSPRAFRRRGAPATCRVAVVGIARACIPDPDVMLRNLLAAAIEECAACVRIHGGAHGGVVSDGEHTRDFGITDLLAACEVAGIQVVPDRPRPGGA